MSEPEPHLPEADQLAGTTSLGQRVAWGVLGVLLTLLGLWTLQGFLAALAWALIFAIAVWPLYRKVRARCGRQGRGIVVPGLFTVGIALLFIVPLGLIALQLGREAHGLMHWMNDAQRTGIPVPAFVQDLPVFGPEAADWWRSTIGDPGSAAELLKRVNRAELLTTGRNLGVEIAHRLALFGFTLLTLFFIFREGDTLARQLRRASRRAFGPAGERVGLQVIASVHGTVDGLVLVGLGEGFVMGITYAVMGVPHATVLGTLTAIAAMIPFGGPVSVCLPPLFLLLQGSTAAAIVLLAIGLAVTFSADHFIRPVLIGGATRLPFIWVLLGILGGLEVWGLLGLFVGPASLAALILLWREWTGPGTTELTTTEPVGADLATTARAKTDLATANVAATKETTEHA
jgi:predicted PurR-regulated permease PerM